jgi:hypothetical protein
VGAEKRREAERTLTKTRKAAKGLENLERNRVQEEVIEREVFTNKKGSE